MYKIIAVKECLLLYLFFHLDLLHYKCKNEITHPSHYLLSMCLYLRHVHCDSTNVIFTTIIVFIVALLVLLMGGQGITAGAHRLWAHRTYKAKLPLRILLAIFQTMAFQNHIYEWVRDHRAHHKFTDTDADPHNASRGNLLNYF